MGWSRPVAVLVSGAFFLIDIPFFAANISKIFHGAWFPLVIGAATFGVMITWEDGREILLNKIKRLTPTL